MITNYPFTTDWQELPDYLLQDPSFNEMSDDELAEYFADSEADKWIEEEKSNPSNYYYEP